MKKSFLSFAPLLLSTILLLPGISTEKINAQRNSNRSYNTTTSKERTQPTRSGSTSSYNRTNSSSARSSSNYNQRSTNYNQRSGASTQSSPSSTYGGGVRGETQNRRGNYNSGNNHRPNGGNSAQPASNYNRRSNATPQVDLTTRGTMRGGKNYGHGGNDNKGDNHRRPGGNYGSGNNHRPGDNNYNRPGGTNNNRPGGTTHDRPGNKPGGNTYNRPGGNNYNRPGHRPGGNSVPYPGYGSRPKPDIHHYPPRPPFGRPSQYYGHWRPLPPPPIRPYNYYGPVSTGRLISSVLGLTFGTLIDYGLNSLINRGYTVSGYLDDAIFLTNVNLLGYRWPQATVYYGYSGLNGALFQYRSASMKKSPYKSVYRQLCSLYGNPVEETQGENYSKAVWWGGNNTGYVTLTTEQNYGNSDDGSYETSLVYGTE